MFHVPNKYRITTGKMGSADWYGNNGAFCIPLVQINSRLRGDAWVIASDGEGWEHVSVHCIEAAKILTPSWEVMANIKDLFWDGEDCVVQFHPPKSEYVNVHKNTLHLWRKIGSEFETPHKILIG